ncbi:MAG: transposase [Clostridia bacterium]|nr:transposase [Clostridia bacterium]
MTDFVKRKPARLKGYDYSAPGAYFITICIRDRKCLLSEFVGDGVLDVPQNKFTGYGKIADKYINQMNGFYEYVSVDRYVIMPNHIHFLLSVKCCENGTSRTPSPTNSVIANFVSTFKRFCNKEFGENIWQRSFHDHIIRSEKDYTKIAEYIETNPLKWERDCFYK